MYPRDCQPTTNERRQVLGGSLAYSYVRRQEMAEKKAREAAAEAATSDMADPELELPPIREEGSSRSA